MGVVPVLSIPQLVTALGGPEEPPPLGVEHVPSNFSQPVVQVVQSAVTSAKVGVTQLLAPPYFVKPVNVGQVMVPVPPVHPVVVSAPPVPLAQTGDVLGVILVGTMAGDERVPENDALVPLSAPVSVPPERGR